MLNLKNNKNDAVINEIKKKTQIKIQFQKMKDTYFFGQHPLVEKSPTATDIYILIFQK